MRFLDFFIKKTLAIYYSRTLGFILHNQLYFLKKELRDCESVLDLGCGWQSLLLYIPVKFSLGTDLWYPYLLESKAKKIHRYYIQADLKKEIPFKDNSFDAVLLLSVIEHLEKEEGISLLNKISRIAKKKIIIITPNGYLKQIHKSDTPLQAHRSGWNTDDFKKLGFKVIGLAGFKFFRKDFHCEDRNDYVERILSTVRFSPRFFWLLVAELSQIISWHFPHLSFELFCVKYKTTESHPYP